MRARRVDRPRHRGRHGRPGGHGSPLAHRDARAVWRVSRASRQGPTLAQAVAARRGAIVLRRGIEQPQAILHAPEQELVALLVGLAPSTPIRVSGDAALASAFITRLHRGQGLV